MTPAPGAGARAAPRSGEHRARAAPRSGEHRARAAPRSGEHRARAAPRSGEHRARAAPVRERRPPEAGGAAVLRLVGERSSASGLTRRTRLLTTVLTSLAAVGLFFIVFLHVLLSQGQMRLDRLESQYESHRSRNERLRVEVAELESPDRVVTEARQRLGMVPPAAVIPLAPAPAPR